MPTLIQTAGGKSLNSTTVAAPFSSANALGNLIAVAVLWFDRTVGIISEPSITLGDLTSNSYSVALSEWYGGGGNLKLEVFYVLACAAGSNTITATASATGVMMIACHEVQADAGQIWQFDGWGFGTNTSTSLLQLFGNGPVHGNDYSFLCFGVNNQSFLPTVAVPAVGWTSRQYVSNSTPIDTGATTTGGAELFFYGSLVTWDGANQGNAAGGSIQLAFPTSFVYASLAITCSFASIIPSCHAAVASPSTGTFVGPQVVTLTQDQGKPLYYTLDGSTPTTGSTLYTTPVTISSSLRLNVLAHDPSNVLADTVAGFNYTILPNPPANSNIAITWSRRTRVGGAWLDGQGAVPLSEQTESYDLYIMSPDGTVIVRSVLGLTSPSFNYTSAMQFSDFGAYQPSVYVKVFQNSATVGHGFPAINAIVGAGLGWVAGSSGDAISILGNPITGSAQDGDIMQFRSGTGNWEIVGPVLRRQNVTKISGSLANNAAETGGLTVNTGMFGLLKVVVDRACRVTLYSTAAFRDADAGRAYGTFPSAVPNGIIADFGLDTPGGETFVCSPAVLGANVDGSPVNVVYYRITNLSGATHTVTVTLTIVPLENL